MKTKRFLALVLCVVMMVTAIPMTAVAQEIEASTEEASYSIHDALQVGAEGEYSTVYYGGIPWRVLSKDYSSDSENENAQVGILLLSEHVLANGIQYNAHYSNNAWSSANKIWASAMVSGFHPTVTWAIHFPFCLNTVPCPLPLFCTFRFCFCPSFFTFNPQYGQYAKF